MDSMEKEWIDCKTQMPPKNRKFLFSYYYGIGLGEWGQCYTTINGNSERTHEAYILVLSPAALLNPEEPFTWDESYMIYMEVKWKFLTEQI
jgi:hypothetical protein